MKTPAFCTMFLGLLLILISPCLALGQEFFGDLMAPPQAPLWNIRTSGESAHPSNQQKFQISAPINHVVSDPAYLTWKWTHLKVETERPLPNGSQIPTDFYSSEYGLNYRHNENESQFWGFTFSAGSAGDKTFQSRTKTVYNATGFYSMSQDPTSRWLWLVNYSNNRSFLNEIPIPGVAYIYRPSADFMALFGFPFAYVRWKLNEDWSSSFLLGPYIYKVDFSRKMVGPIQAYFAADNSLQSFYRDARDRDEDRLFYSESRALVGLKFPLHQIVFADIFGGYAYSRTISEGEDFKDAIKDSTYLENRWLFGAQLNLRF